MTANRCLRLAGGILTALLAANLSMAAEMGPAAEPLVGAKEVAAFVCGSLGETKGLRVEVETFRYADGKDSVEGRVLSADLRDILAKTPGLQVIPDKPASASAAQGTGEAKDGVQPGAKPPESAPANRHVFGHLVDMGPNLLLTVRVVDDRSKALGMKRFSVAKKAADKEDTVWGEIERIKQKERPFGIEIWTDKKEYRIGEELVIHFKAERECYATIFNLGTSGNVTVLLPNRFYENNHLTTLQTYSIPSQYQNFSINVQGPAGTEKLKIFATVADVPLLPTQYLNSAFRKIEEGDRAVARDIGIKLGGVDKTAWAEANWEFKVTAEQADATGKGN